MKKERTKLTKTRAPEDYLAPGIGLGRIYNIYTADQTEINQAVKDALNPLVANKKILDLMLQEDNLQKLRTRFELRSDIIDEDGMVVATSTQFNKTLKEGIKELVEKIPQGTVLNYQKEKDINLLIIEKLHRAERIQTTLMVRKGTTGTR